MTRSFRTLLFSLKDFRFTFPFPDAKLTWSFLRFSTSLFTGGLPELEFPFIPSWRNESLRAIICFYQEAPIQQYGWIWRCRSLFLGFFGSFFLGGGREGGNDNGFYMATSLYRSVDGSRLSLIRDLSKRGVYVPLWDAIDTPLPY